MCMDTNYPGAREAIERVEEVEQMIMGTALVNTSNYEYMLMSQSHLFNC